MSKNKVGTRSWVPTLHIWEWRWEQALPLRLRNRPIRSLRLHGLESHAIKKKTTPSGVVSFVVDDIGVEHFLFVLKNRALAPKNFKSQFFSRSKISAFWSFLHFSYKFGDNSGITSLFRILRARSSSLGYRWEYRCHVICTFECPSRLAIS